LAQWSHDKHWEVDWETYRHHHELAQRFALKQDHRAAFREYCRAISPFTEALRRHRSKEESFQPVWERTQAQA
jgi:hypothetical protein